MPEESIALDDVSLNIDDNELVGIIGHTGSGKSTLVQHLNGLLKPSSGEILVDGVNLTDSKISMIDVRKKVGLVFQYPEYQLFEETVEKDWMKMRSGDELRSPWSWSDWITMNFRRKAPSTYPEGKREGLPLQVLSP